jgi:hypothetical protein
LIKSNHATCVKGDIPKMFYSSKRYELLNQFKSLKLNTMKVSSHQLIKEVLFRDGNKNYKISCKMARINKN